MNGLLARWTAARQARRMARADEMYPTCPTCGSRTGQQWVVLTDDGPSPASPFVLSEVAPDSPAVGCERCGTTYGNWKQAND